MAITNRLPPKGGSGTAPPASQKQLLEASKAVKDAVLEEVKMLLEDRFRGVEADLGLRLGKMLGEQLDMPEIEMAIDAQIQFDIEQAEAQAKQMEEMIKNPDKIEIE